MNGEGLVDSGSKVTTNSAHQLLTLNEQFSQTTEYTLEGLSGMQGNSKQRTNLVSKLTARLVIVTAAQGQKHFLALLIRAENIWW
ncbi:hypothetical protein O9992_27425 [Vibrio lentus]|nr:hypothetical protein [Vibrio lentus]